MRDAQGNTMATYDVKKQGDDWQMGLDEFVLYGSSRLGVVKNITGTDVIAGEAPVLYASDGTGSIGFTGLKLETLVTEEYALLQPWQLNYELSNFRGDAHVIVTADSKTICDGDFMAYAPQIQSSTDMYSFGMEMPERTDVAMGADYRFGFNGQEKDRELNPNITTALFWEYDSRIARRWNLDPVPTGISDYSVFSLNPILMIDPLGNTDIYNSEGTWIGYDGIDNGEKRIVLKKSIAKAIQRKTEHKKDIIIKKRYEKWMISPMSEDEIDRMENILHKTQNSQVEDAYVWGSKNGNSTSLTLPEDEKEPGKFNLGKLYDRALGDEYNIKYDAHAHHASIMYKPNANDPSQEEYAVTTPNPSAADYSFRRKLEKNGFKSPGFIIGYETPNTINADSKDVQNAKSNPKKYVAREGNFPVVVTVYNSKRPLLHMTIEKYRELNKKVNSDDPKSRRPKK